jgi:hypothetical protein
VQAAALAVSGFNRGGSMARFAITGNHLYTVDFSSMFIFDLNNGADLLERGQISLPVGIETIFPYSDKLFLGSNNGMHIYSIHFPSSPEYISSFEHARSCDPVVVQGDFAYVTLRGGNECWGFMDSRLDIIDISDINHPVLRQTYPMTEPYGLGIDGHNLFICEGSLGLKVYNSQKPDSVKLIQTFPDVHAFDVIPFNKVLMMIGEDGLFQYSYSQEQLELLSHIPVIN